MEIDLGIDQEEIKTTRCGLKISCMTGNRSPWWKRVEFLVSTLPDLQNLPTEYQEKTFFEMTLTFSPKKLYNDSLSVRIERIVKYARYLKKNKFKFFFLPEYHSQGECAGLIHYHGIIFNRDYVASMKAIRYWTRENGRLSAVKKDFSQTGKLSYATWLTYCTKDKDLMDYKLTPIVTYL